MPARSRRTSLRAIIILLIAAASAPSLSVTVAGACPQSQAPPAPPATSLAAPPSQADRALRLFIDCTNAYCDDEFFRSEITFVDHVRDRRDADVHALVTSQATGSGGKEYSVAFIGLGRFDKIDHTLRYFATSTDTDDMTRRGLVGTLKVGLVRYVSDTPPGRDLQVTYKPPKAAAGTTAAHDPWDYWAFRTSLQGSTSGEESSTSVSVYGSVSANRTTDAWKIETNAGGSYSQSKYTFPEGDYFESYSRSTNASALIVKSLTNHWSAGGRGSVSSSTYLNQALKLRLAPAVEYNLFPYSESTRRQLTFNYSVGANHFNYIETTIYGKDTESLVDQSLLVTLDMRQPWGTTSTSFQASQYLNDTSKNRLVLYGEVDVRLFKGFSLSGWGSVSRIRDQVYLPKGEATNEEVLVRQRQLATSYEYYMSIGFSYRFGSIFNNVVNPRFGGSSGGMYFYY
jgi:hypothetical protein